MDGPPKKKRSAVITPMNSANFMNIDLRSFSIPMLRSLVTTIEKNIKSRLSLPSATPAPATKQPAFVDISSWGTVTSKKPLQIDWDRTKIRNEKNELTQEALSLLVQNQEGRHVDPKQEFPWTYMTGKRNNRCSAALLSNITLFYIPGCDGVLCTHCFLANGGKKINKFFFYRPFQTWHKLGEKYAEHVKAERCKLTHPHEFNFQRLQDLLPTVQVQRTEIVMHA